VRGEKPEVGTPVSPSPESLEAEAPIQGKCESYDQMLGGREVAFFV